MASPGRSVLFYAWADSPHTHRWAEGLQARGYEISVISLGGWPVRNCPTTIFPHSGKTAYFRFLMSALQETARIKPGLLHLHAASGFGLWALATRVRPLVVSVWGSDILEFAATPLGRMIVPATLRAADVVCATSRFLADATIRVAPGCKEKLQIIPFGVSPVREILEEPPTDPFRLCMLKADRELYGAADAILALSVLSKEGHEVTLTILRPGPLRGQLEELIRHHGLQQRVTLIDQVDHDAIYPLISKHHVLLMPSHQESFGVAALEAGACQRAVVATNVGGIPEVVQHGQTGLLVAPHRPDELASAIRKLMNDNNCRLGLAGNGRAFVAERYLWSHSLDAMAGVYEKVLRA